MRIVVLFALWFIFGLGHIRIAYATEIQISAHHGKQTRSFHACKNGKHYQLKLDSNLHGPWSIDIQKENFRWMESQLVEISKLKKDAQPCQDDEVLVKVSQASNQAVEYEVCLFAKDKRAKSMRKFFTQLMASI